MKPAPQPHTIGRPATGYLVETRGTVAEQRDFESEYRKRRIAFAWSELYRAFGDYVYGADEGTKSDGLREAIKAHAALKGFGVKGPTL